MEYHPSMIGDKDNVRYALFQKGKRTLYVVALNPSTATDEKIDPTMRRIIAFSEKNGFDGFVMLNLYPQRSTNPFELPVECDQKLYCENIKIIESFLKEEVNPTVLFCYGTNFGIRKYLKDSVAEINQLCDNYHARKVCVALTKYGVPRHPLYTKVGEFIEML